MLHWIYSSKLPFLFLILLILFYSISYSYFITCRNEQSSNPGDWCSFPVYRQKMIYGSINRNFCMLCFPADLAGVSFAHQSHWISVSKVPAMGRRCLSGLLWCRSLFSWKSPNYFTQGTDQALGYAKVVWAQVNICMPKVIWSSTGSLLLVHGVTLVWKRVHTNKGK